MSSPDVAVSAVRSRVNSILILHSTEHSTHLIISDYCIAYTALQVFVPNVTLHVASPVCVLLLCGQEWPVLGYGFSISVLCLVVTVIPGQCG